MTYFHKNEPIRQCCQSFTHAPLRHPDVATERPRSFDVYFISFYSSEMTDVQCLKRPECKKCVQHKLTSLLCDILL